MRYAAPLVALLLVAGSQAPVRQAPQARPAFNVFEASIAEMQAAMKSGRTTSRADRAAVPRPASRSTKTCCTPRSPSIPKALEEADARDRERAQGASAARCTASRSRSRTTSTRPTCRRPAARSRSKALVPPYEATLTKNLRDAGAIIIAKTGMTELANYVAAGMPTNYNAVHGYGFNPYDPRRDPRDDSATAVRCCRPADRAPASARRRTSGPATSAPRPRVRS